ARRMEVFTATYNRQLQPITAPEALILHEESFAQIKQPIIFTGNGALKWQSICKNPHANWILAVDNLPAMAELSHQQFKLQTFAVTAYAEPFYLKAFYSSKY
ncbi:MAG: tRNA ((37)-N6)-threonylcarbamoyltransferase complex dimerization subunit type 1 TsaB, partial [Bacteroidota bacterium]